MANYDRQANFERNFEGKSLYCTTVNCTSNDFLLHVITNPKSKKAQQSRQIAEAKCGRIWPLSGVTDKKFHGRSWPLSGVMG